MCLLTVVSLENFMRHECVAQIAAGVECDYVPDDERFTPYCVTRI